MRAPSVPRNRAQVQLDAQPHPIFMGLIFNPTGLFWLASSSSA